MRLIRYAAAATVVLFAATASAQSGTLVGTWQVEYQRGLRNENGEITPVMGKGTLTLEQRGDSLIGQLVSIPGDDGRQAPPMTLAARASGASATLISTSNARINMNGDERVVKSTLTWELTANGDTLTGTMKRSMEGMEMGSEPTPVRGTRTGR
jgi:hypothetical protein